MEAGSLARTEGGLTIPRSRKLLSALGDERLVAQLRRGNDAAFEVLYDRHHRGVLSYCRHMLGSQEEAEDALQQAFISAHGDLVSTDKPIRFKAWIYTIARNRCLSMLRARREQPSDDLDRISTAGLSEEVQQREDLQELLSDMQELPDEQRAALILSELGDLSHRDVAEIIGCEAAKVKSLVFQARSGLMERREARETPCEEIREQLATLRGGSLRRGPLRRHVKACPGCAEFREEVRRQRQLVAAVLPVVPSLGLKESALAAVGLGTISGGGGGLLIGGGGGVAAVLQSGAAKVAVVAVATGGAVGGGVAMHEVTKNSNGPEKARAAERPPGQGAPAGAAESDAQHENRSKKSKTGDRRKGDRDRRRKAKLEDHVKPAETTRPKRGAGRSGVARVDRPGRGLGRGRAVGPPSRPATPPGRRAPAPTPVAPAQPAPEEQPADSTPPRSPVVGFPQKSKGEVPEGEDRHGDKHEDKRGEGHFKDDEDRGQDKDKKDADEDCKDLKDRAVDDDDENDDRGEDCEDDEGEEDDGDDEDDD